MIQAKVFELRDAATFIPVIAVLVMPNQSMHQPYETTQAEQYLLRRVGYPYGERNVLLMRASGEPMSRGLAVSNDPLEWSDRTFQTAHDYITREWNNLTDGQVICVEHILGERTEPKQSEAHNGRNF